ncbi:MAG: hypothetical protein QXU99_06575 [Candidatus Bathyarchaeia archaeon]
MKEKTCKDHVDLAEQILTESINSISRDIEIHVSRGYLLMLKKVRC